MHKKLAALLLIILSTNASAGDYETGDRLGEKEIPKMDCIGLECDISTSDIPNLYNFKASASNNGDGVITVTCDKSCQARTRYGVYVIYDSGDNLGIEFSCNLDAGQKCGLISDPNPRRMHIAFSNVTGNDGWWSDLSSWFSGLSASVAANLLMRGRIPR